jgi:hypothetical protein
MAAPETPFAAGQDNIWTKILDHNKLAARQPGTYGYEPRLQPICPSHPGSPG